MTAPGRSTPTPVPPEHHARGSLDAVFGGEILRPGDPTYDLRRAIWNGSIDRHPAVIARCGGVDDVRAAVHHARETGLQIAVRGGGHSFPGFSTCEDGLVIDLSPMNGIRVDPHTGIARVQAGALLGDLDRSTQHVGMVVPSGIVTHTGVAGLTLGGGIGWLMRRFGLTIDQVVSVDVVTADGTFLTADPDTEPDLFWGVRGGGGNFGIVTEFRFRLNPLAPEVTAGPVFWPMEDSPEVMRFYRDWITGVPDELTTVVLHRKAPASPVIPEELHGRPVVAVIGCYAGPADQGLEVLRPIKEFGRPLLDLCVPKPFLAHQSMFDASYPHGRWYYFRSHDVAELSDPLIDVIVEHALRIESPLTSFPVFHLGGAVASVGDDDTAFSGRHAGHTINLAACTETAAGFDREVEWVRDFSARLAPYQSGVYVNFMMAEGGDRVRQAYGAAKYDRLRAVKRRYDPDNVFRLNQNIPPD